MILLADTFQASAYLPPPTSRPEKVRPIHLQPRKAEALAKKSFWRSWLLSDRWGLIQRGTTRNIRSHGRPRITLPERVLKMRAFGGKLRGNQLATGAIRPLFAVRIH